MNQKLLIAHSKSLIPAVPQLAVPAGDGHLLISAPGSFQHLVTMSAGDAVTWLLMLVSAGLELFGPLHVAILSLAAVVPYLLARLFKRLSRIDLGRWILVVILAGAELLWYKYCIQTGLFRFPDGLPLQLCDFVLWVTVTAAITLNPLLLEVSFYGGLAGCGSALLTPDLWAPLGSYPSIQFFVSHGLVVAMVLYLFFTGTIPHRKGSALMAWLVLNAYLAFLAVFNTLYGTNYGYLREKPDDPTLLDYMGPWPFYILSGELFSVAVFWLLSLLLRLQATGVGSEPANR